MVGTFLHLVFKHRKVLSFFSTLKPLYTSAVIHQFFSGVACRKCVTNGTWDFPNFDSCTDQVYEDILTKVCSYKLQLSGNFKRFSIL